MQKKLSRLETLIAGGLIGSLFGAFLLKDKEEGAIVGALLGAAVSATLKANKEAHNTEVPLYMVEDGNLIEMSPTGEKRIVRKV